MAKGKKGRSGAAKRAGTAESQSQNSTMGIVIGVVAVLAIVGLVAFFVSRNNSGSPASGGNCTEVNGETITTPSGLKYQDLTVCQGTPAKNGDSVSAHYTGSLENGSVFDSSFNHQPPQPYTFPLGQGQVIKGWDEGILGMTVGSKRKLIIPPSLGYGAQAQQGIPANSTLIFTVQVMGINQ